MTTQTAVTAADAETTVMEYRLHVKGVYGRNRTAKFQTIHLADRALDAPIDTFEMDKLVADALALVKPKPGLRWQVIATETKVSKSTYDGKVFTSRSFMMFSGKNVAQGTHLS
jgi:hypothetical protein